MAGSKAVIPISAESLLIDAIVSSEHPEIAWVQFSASSPEEWCRIKVGFADGSTAYIHTELAR